MRDLRPDPQQEMNACISQHWRDGWVLLRWMDSPPRARLRRVENPQNLPLGGFVRPMSRSQKINYREITIGADGCVIWHDLPVDHVGPGNTSGSQQAITRHWA